MTLRIPSSRPEFEGFEAYYATALAPFLRLREEERRQAVNRFFIIAAAGIAGAVIVFLILSPFGGVGVQLAFFFGVLVIGGANWLLDRTRNDIGHGLINRIASKLGFTYTGELERPTYYDRFKQLKMLPSHNREEWEDEVRGVYYGADFTFCEAHLIHQTSGKNRRRLTKFRGQLFIIDYPHAFLGTTVILRDMGALNRLTKPGREFSRVGLVSSKFEKEFETWSTDQVEARELLDPLVLERFLEIERLYDGKKIRAAFADGKLLIAVETGDRLSLGTMFKPIVGAKRVETILSEFDAVFGLIDVLLKPIDGRLSDPFTLRDVEPSNEGARRGA